MAFTLSKLFGQIRNSDPLLDDISPEELWSGQIGNFRPVEPRRLAGAASTGSMDFLLYGDTDIATGTPLGVRSSQSDPLAGEGFAGDPFAEDPFAEDPFGGSPTGAQPTGAQPTGAQPTGAQPTGAQPTDGGLASLLGLSERDAAAPAQASLDNPLPGQPKRGEQFAMLVHREGMSSVADLNASFRRGWRVAHLASLPGSARTGAALVVLCYQG